MNGKKITFCVLLALLSVKAFPQAMTLDEAIKTTASELGQQINAHRIPNVSSSNQSLEQTAAEIRQQLTAQTKIAVLNFSSSWQELSAYVIDELNNAIVRDSSLTVVDRQQLDLVRKEQNFQMSGDVDDNSAQSAGKWLGAQSVLTGSFTEIGKNTYRFRVRVIAVETGVLQYSNSIEIKKDRVLRALMDGSSKAKKNRTTSGYTLYNGLSLFGYTYSLDKPVGFSLGVYGVYTSFGFAVPSWGEYRKEDSNYTSSRPYTDQRYQIIDWAIGYNVTIIPNILYLPLGIGTEAVKEWRLQELGSSTYSIGGGGSSSLRTVWTSVPQWEKSLLFEAGLLFRVITPVNFAPYLFGTYRNIGLKKHTFSVGAGGCFDFLANK